MKSRRSRFVGRDNVQSTRERLSRKNASRHDDLETVRSIKASDERSRQGFPVYLFTLFFIIWNDSKTLSMNYRFVAGRPPRNDKRVGERDCARGRAVHVRLPRDNRDGNVYDRAIRSR